MKKQVKIYMSLILLLFGLLSTKSYAAISGNISLQAPGSATKGEEIYVYAHVSNLQAGKGIIAIGTTLEYDTNALTFVDIDGEGKWSAPFHNEANGKLTATRNKASNASENIFKVTFRVKESAGDSAWVRVRNFEISNGSEESVIGSGNANISIQTKQPEPPVEEEPPAEEPPTTTTKPSTPNNNRPSTTNKKPTIQEETRVEETPPVQEPVEEAPVQNEVVANSVLANFVTENILVLGQEKGNTISNELEMPTFAEKQDAENYTWLIIAVVSIIGVLGIGVAIYAVKVWKK